MSDAIGYAPPGFEFAIDLDLSKNEGRAPDDASLATVAPAVAQLPRYPDLQELQQIMAATFGVASDRLLVTAGGDDALLRLCLLTLRPGKQALVAVPTFEMIPRYVALAGGELCQVPWPGGAFPIDALLARVSHQTAIVFVVSPNNPTGAVASSSDLARVARALPDAVIVLDAAYAEFADDDLMATAQQFANVVIVRTLSKAWGLAGLRVGCAICTKQLVAALHASGNPMPVSVASAALAVRRLQNGTADVADHVAMVRAQRTDLVQLLARLGAKPVVPCQGNFVLAHGVASQWLTAAMASLGIAIRRFVDQPLLHDAVRIALPAESQSYARLQRALATVLKPKALLFDMDGVLADVSQSYRTAIVLTAADFGVTVSDADIVAAKLRGNANDDWQLTRSLLAERGVACSLAEVTERFEAWYRELRDRERLMLPKELLQAWSRRYRLAVVTGRPKEQAEYFLQHFGIRELFAVVVSRDDAPLKPDPAPVRLALQQLQEQAAWMFGDTVDDMAAARAAGVLPIGIGSTVPAKSAAVVLPNVADLEAML